MEFVHFSKKGGGREGGGEGGREGEREGGHMPITANIIKMIKNIYIYIDFERKSFLPS